MTAWTFELVNQTFANNGCVLLESVYTNTRQPLRFVCSCGKDGVRVLSKFLKSPFCKSCGYKQTGEKNGRLTLDEAQAIFADKGCQLLATEYVNSSTKMPYLCKCGNSHEMSLANFKKGKRCPACVGKTQWTLEIVRAVFRSHGCELIEEEYSGINAAMRYRCDCGNNSFTSLGNFLKGVRCKECGIKKLSGANNYLYDPSLTDAHREKKRLFPEYSVWRKQVLSRDNYTCNICGARGQRMHAHHLDSYARNPALRTDVDNGVTLCKECHDAFHLAHGVCRPTTRGQFEEYRTVKNG